MFCPNCGNELPDDARFCQRCGTQIQAGDAFAEQPRQPTKRAQGPGLQRILMIVAVLLAVGIAALTGAILAQRQGGSADAALKARTDDSDKKDEQGSDASEQAAAKEDKEDTNDAEAEAAAKKLAEERESLQKQAESNGEQVFVGIVHVCNGERAASLLGSEVGPYGNGAGAEYSEPKTQYALLELDSTVSVYATRWNDSPIDKDTDYIQIGVHRYNAFKDRFDEADTASQWNAYDGARVCVAATDFSMNDGFTIITVPVTDTARLLYTFDEDESVAESRSADSATADVQTPQVPYDPTQFKYTETTFETMDFIVTVPAEWEGIWEHGTASQQSFGYNWLFSVQDSTAVPGFVGGGICVTSNPNKPSAGGVTERVFDEPSSNGMYLWYVAGDPQGFFEAHGGKATITLK